MSVERFGSVVALTPQSTAARVWIDENCQSEPWQWLCGTLNIDIRMADDMLRGMVNDGFDPGIRSITMKFSLNINLNGLKENGRHTGTQLAKLLDSIALSVKDKDIERQYGEQDGPLTSPNTGAIRLPDGTAVGTWTVK